MHGLEEDLDHLGHVLGSGGAVEDLAGHGLFRGRGAAVVEGHAFREAGVN
jgi:hypothetical protein